MTLRDQLEALRPAPTADATERALLSRERHRLKAQAVAALKLDGHSWSKGNRTLTIIDGPILRDGLVELSVKVTRNGVDVTPPDLNPILVSNAPTVVADPAGDIVVPAVIAFGRVTPERRYREDVRAAFLNALREALG